MSWKEPSFLGPTEQEGKEWEAFVKQYAEIALLEEDLIDRFSELNWSDETISKFVALVANYAVWRCGLSNDPEPFINFLAKHIKAYSKLSAEFYANPETAWQKWRDKKYEPDISK